LVQRRQRRLAKKMPTAIWNRVAAKCATLIANIALSVSDACSDVRVVEVEVSDIDDGSVAITKVAQFAPDLSWHAHPGRGGNPPIWSPKGSQSPSSSGSLPPALQPLLQPRQHLVHVLAAVLALHNPVPLIWKQHQSRRHFSTLQDLESGHALTKRHPEIEFPLCD
jgi:hypothetical protein